MTYQSHDMLVFSVWKSVVAGVLVGLTVVGGAVAQQTYDPGDVGSLAGACRQSNLAPIGRLAGRQSDQIDGARWGVSCHWIADRHELSVQQQLDRLAWLGAKWAFLCPDWDRIEREPGKYDWNSPEHRLDEVIAGLIERKITPVIQIYGGNRLYMPFRPDPNKRPLADAAKLLDDQNVRDAWHRFIEAIIKRYSQQVRHWEIWNEPNMQCFWTTEPPAADYSQLVKDAASIIRRLDSRAVVIAGSTAGVPLDYAGGFLAGQGADWFDHWAVHPYGELPEAQDDAIRKVQELFRLHNASTTVWQSECGFPSSADTGGWGYGGPWDETKHAKWVLRRLLCDAALDMPVSIYFVLTDYPAALEGGPNRGQMGVNRKGLFAAETWAPKPAAFAFRNLAALIDQRLEPRACNPRFQVEDGGSFGQVDPQTIRALTLADKQSGSTALVYWLPAQMQTESQPARVRLTFDGPPPAEPVLVDLLDGMVYRVKVVESAGETTFADLPLYDSPVVLCDRTLVEPMLRP